MPVEARKVAEAAKTKVLWSQKAKGSVDLPQLKKAKPAVIKTKQQVAYYNAIENKVKKFPQIDRLKLERLAKETNSTPSYMKSASMRSRT